MVQADVASPVGAIEVTAKHPSLLRGLLRHPLGLPSIVVLLLLTLAAIFAPLLAPAPPLAQDFSHVLSLPSGLHWLGTDQLGRDVLSRMLYGGRISLIGVVETVSVALVIGLVLGVLSGYIGRTLDAVLSRIIEVVMAIPAIVVLLMVFSLFNNNNHVAMLTLGFLSVPTLFRVARAATLQVKEAAYVTSAKVTGVSSFGIMLRHIVPRIYGPVVVNTAVLAALTLGIQAGLNFLGLGVTPPAPSWGGLVAEAQSSIQEQPWLIIPTGGIVALTILALVLLGDALRDVLGARATGNRHGSATQVASPDPETPAEGVGDVLLSVRNLTVVFGSGDQEVRVVQNASFDLPRGAAVGLVGESGCGKTVTSTALLGLLRGGRVTAGAALLDGEDLFTMSPRRRQELRGTTIGFVSQEPMTALDPNYTVGSQLTELVGLHEKLSKTARRERVLELLWDVGLTDAEEVSRKYPHQISGGMAQRVSIAAALAGRPKLLIADEPTTALDVTVQAGILDLLRKLQAEHGMTILIITHDLGVVADLCSSAVVMYAGEVVETATVQELMYAPRHPYTKALLASNPAFGEAGKELPAIPGTVPLPLAWPVGCHFADRCVYQQERCTTGPIPLLADGDSTARCIRVQEIPKDLATASEDIRHEDVRGEVSA